MASHMPEIMVWKSYIRMVQNFCILSLLNWKIKFESFLKICKIRCVYSNVLSSRYVSIYVIVDQINCTCDSHFCGRLHCQRVIRSSLPKHSSVTLVLCLRETLRAHSSVIFLLNSLYVLCIKNTTCYRVFEVNAYLPSYTV